MKGIDTGMKHGVSRVAGNMEGFTGEPASVAGRSGVEEGKSRARRATLLMGVASTSWRGRRTSMGKPYQGG